MCKYCSIQQCFSHVNFAEGLPINYLSCMLGLGSSFFRVLPKLQAVLYMHTCFACMLQHGSYWFQSDRGKAVTTRPSAWAELQRPHWKGCMRNHGGPLMKCCKASLSCTKVCQGGKLLIGSANAEGWIRLQTITVMLSSIKEALVRNN